MSDISTKLDDLIKSVHEIDKKVAVQCRHIKSIDRTIREIKEDNKLSEDRLRTIEMEHSNRSSTCEGVTQLSEIVKEHEATMNKFKGIKSFIAFAVTAGGAIGAGLFKLLNL